MNARRSAGSGARISEEPGGLSRAEIETLCVVYAVGAGCCVVVLTERLGLPPVLAAVVQEAVEQLVAEGLLSFADGDVSVTTAGSARLESQLSLFDIP